jgi:hypothetical protein
MDETRATEGSAESEATPSHPAGTREELIELLAVLVVRQHRQALRAKPASVLAPSPTNQKLTDPTAR